MTFTEFLSIEILDNSVEQILWFFGTLLVILVLDLHLSTLLISATYRLLHKFIAKEFYLEFKKLLIRPISIFLLLFTMSLAFNFLNFPEALNVEIYKISLQSICLKLVKAALLFCGIWIFLRVVDFVVYILRSKAEQTETQTDDQMVLFVNDLFKFIVILIGCFILIGGVLDINITSLVAGAGIAGIAVAFAAKDSIENLFGSFTIFIERPFTVGDFIQIGDVIGTVEKVGFRSTRIRTLEKSYVTLPNRKIIDSTMDNLTLRTFRRVSFNIGLLYGTKSEVIKTIVSQIQDLLDLHQQTNQEGVVGFYGYGPSSLDILITYYVNNTDWNNFIKIREDLNFGIMEIVEKNGADFAFPTQTVHLHKEN